jgi:uncharacterized membrane protein
MIYPELTRRQIVVIACIAAVGILLRIAAIHRSYWFDELATLVHVDYGDWASVLQVTSRDLQPPLYNSSVFIWIRLFGRSEIAVRSLSLILGLLALATPWLARAALTRGEKIFSFAILCVMMMPIKYAQEARNYSLLLLLSSACLFAYYEILTAQRRGLGPGRLQVFFYAALTLLAFAHLFGLLLFASFLAVMFLRAGSLRARLLIAVLGAIIVAAVMLPLLHGGAGSNAGGKFWIVFTPLSFVQQLLLVFTPAGIVLFAYALIRRRGAGASPFDPDLTQALAPFALMLLGGILVSLHTPIINERNLIPLVPAFAVLTARLLQPPIQRDSAWIAAALLAIVLLQSVILLGSSRMFIREDFRAIAEHSIAANTKVCYVVPVAHVADWHSIMAYYTVRLFGRPDLDPRTIAADDVPQAFGECRLWGEGHLESRDSIVRPVAALKSCSEVPLGPPAARIASVLLACDH